MKQKQIAKIHILKKELQLDDAVYRVILARVTGKDSAKHMSIKELNAVIDELSKLNGNTGVSLFKPSPCSRTRKIYKLWSTLYKQGIVKNGSNLSLNTFVQRFNVSLNQLNKDFSFNKEKNEIIEALKSMQIRGCKTSNYATKKS